MATRRNMRVSVRNDNGDFDQRMRALSRSANQNRPTQSSTTGSRTIMTANGPQELSQRQIRRRQNKAMKAMGMPTSRWGH